MPLAKLLTNGVECKLFDIKPICQIPKSPSQTAQTEVIDFDKVKSSFIQGLNQKAHNHASHGSNFGIDEPKSCDALKIIPEKARIDFIEFKGFQDFKKYNAIRNQHDARITQQVESFDLDTKIEDSCWLFSGILHISRLALSKDERKRLISLDKNYLVMVDITVKSHPEQNFAATMQFLSQSAVDKAIVDCLEDKLDSMEIPYRVNKPILIGADDIDRFYQDVLVGQNQKD